MDLSWAQNSQSPHRAVPAGLISMAAHLALLWAITTGAQAKPPKPDLSPLRFAGQTFEVDAIGDGEQAAAQAPSAESAPSPEGEPELPSGPEPPQVSEPKPTPKPEPKPQPEAQPAPETQPAPEAQPESLANPKPKPRPSAQPQASVDPFDLALPGEATPSAPVASPSETGTYGAEGEPPGVTDIYKAFLHMFPEANRHRDEWKSLPVGLIGRVEFVIILGKNARIVSLQIDHTTEPAPPNLLVDAVRKTRRSLQFQRLGWEGERREGAQRLAVTARVMKKPPHKDSPDRAGTQKHGRFGEGRPDAAFFTYYDGHHIEIELKRLGTVGGDSE